MRRASLRLTLLPLLALLGAALLGACGDTEEFPADLPDDAYPLEEMLLDLADLPIDMDSAETHAFSNEAWAQSFDVENLRGKIAQIEARGRVTGALRVFSWDGPFAVGGPLYITVQSTLYTDVAAAEDSLSLYCGTLTDERSATDVVEFWVDDIGDGVQGLLMGEQVADMGRGVRTIVCFRTGRVVHAIDQRGFDGSQDIRLSVRIARRMFEHVQAVFADLESPDPS